MLDDGSFLDGLKQAITWVLVPVVALFTYMFKSQHARVDTLSHQNQESLEAQAKFTVEIDNLKDSIKEVNAKLDKIIDYLWKSSKK